MADAEQVKDAAEVYVYGYPLVYDLKEVASFVEGGASLPMQAPYNSFASARRLLGPETRFVSPNNDTLYVGGQCDVRQGPLVLHVPDTHTTATTFSSSWTPGPTTSPTSGGGPPAPPRRSTCSPTATTMDRSPMA